jgi:hypothetical protein
MTKKDYIEIAAVIRKHLEERPYNHWVAEERRQHLEELAQDLCVILQRDNPRFDKFRFLALCGL